MFFAGTFDFSSDNAVDKVEKTQFLNFPVRVPLEKQTWPQYKKHSTPTTPVTPTQDNTVGNNLEIPEVACVATGQRHMLCVINGIPYGMGSNAHWQLGGPHLPESVNYFREVGLYGGRYLSSPVKQIACGRRHTLVLAENGEVLVAGDNEFCQLGVTPTGRKADRATAGKDNCMGWTYLRVSNAPVVAIAAGLETSYALTADNQLFSWGRGSSLALGHPLSKLDVMDPKTLMVYTQNIDIPTRVEAFVNWRCKVVEVAAGNDHFVARDAENVYVCGQGSFGRCGSGDTKDYPVPHRVVFPERKTPETLLQVAASAQASFVLRRNPDFGNIVYVWGRETQSPDGTMYPRILSEAPLNISRLLCSAGNTMNMALTEDGTLFTWGHHRLMGNLMLFNTRLRRVPSPVDALEDIKVREACCAGGGCVLITADLRGTLEKYGGDVAAAKAALLRAVIVPYDKRASTATVARNNAKLDENGLALDYYDAASERFYQQYLGESEGLKFYSSCEKPAPYVPPPRPTITKGGAKALHIGSKVRVWLTDVYALGTVTNVICDKIVSKRSRDSQNVSQEQTPTLTPKKGFSLPGVLSYANQGRSNSSVREPPPGGEQRLFEITWARDDWDPEMLELYSEDETLDEECPNRWQRLWFLGEPESQKGV